MPTRTEILTILLLFLIGIIVASYLDKHVLNILPDELASYFEIKLFVRSDSDNELKTNEGISDKNDFTSDLNAKFSSSSEPLDSYVPLVHGNHYYCSNNKSPINKKQINPVYSWKDDEGVTNLSDKRPSRKQAGVKIIDFDSFEMDYFDVNINYPMGGINGDISNNIRNNAINFYKIISGFMGLHNMGRSKLNVHVFNNENSYQEYRVKTNANIDHNTLGFYNSGTNIAAVLHTGDINRTTRTALHEIMHVINHESFGRIPRWLNEGLAEYFENIDFSNKSRRVFLDKSWERQINNNFNKISLTDLFADNNANWLNESRTDYYAFSWSFIYFLMEPNNREYMADLFYEISEDKCDFTDFSKLFNSIYPGGMRKLQVDWVAYLQSNKESHIF